MAEHTYADPPSVFTALRYDIAIAKSHQSEPSSPFYLSDLHRQRLLESAVFFSWTAASAHPVLANVESWEMFLSREVSRYQLDHDVSVGVDTWTPLKVRVMLPRDGNIAVDFAPVPTTPMRTLFPSSLDEIAVQGDESAPPPFRIILDWASLEATPYTYLKTTQRAEYDAARARMNSALAALDAASPAARPAAGNIEILLQNPLGEVTEGSITNAYFLRAGRWVTPPVGPHAGGLAGTARRWALEQGICAEEVVKMTEVSEGEEVIVSNGVRGFLSGKVVWAKGETGSQLVR